MQVRLVCLPVALMRRFQFPQPMHPERHVPDFIVMDDVHHRRAALIARIQEILFELQRVVEIATLEGQRQAKNRGASFLMADSYIEPRIMKFYERQGMSLTDSKFIKAL